MKRQGTTKPPVTAKPDFNPPGQQPMTDPVPAPSPKIEMYRCQFCEKESPARHWKRLHDNCPKCGRAYDPILAQEMDEL